MTASGFRQTVLPNGLRVVTKAMPGVHTVSLAVSVDVGARFESEEKSGISHFLEHMAFKGTKRRSALEIAEEMDEVGASMNAFTSSESTVYYARFLPEDLGLVVDVLADILQNSTFEADELERERGVILQEIAMHKDSPDDLVFDHFHEVVYPDQPLGRSILGTPDHINRFKAVDFRDYMRQHYCPARMVVSAAGNVDHDQIVRRVGECFHFTEPGQTLAPPRGTYIGGDKRSDGNFEQMHLIMGFPGLSYGDPDYYAAQLMVTALGGGMSSRLFQEVREKRGLVYSVYAFQSSYSDGGMFGVYAAAGQEKAGELVPVLSDEILKLADNGISEGELARAQRQHIAGLKMISENVSSVAEWLGRHMLCYGEFRGLDDLSERYHNVTTADIKRAMNRMLEAGPVSLAALGPHKELTSYDTIAGQFARRRAA